LELLRTRPLPVQVLLVGLIPIAYGALCGWVLGESKTAYLILSLIALIGAYVAGQEHEGAGQGALRGVAGGLLFGGALLLVHEATGNEPKTKLPDPKIILLAVTILVGAGAGALGGRRRAAKEEEDEEDKPEFDIKRIKPSEFIGFAGAVIMAVALFLLPWFSSSCASKAAALASGGSGGCNPNSKIELASGFIKYGTFTGWETYTYIRYLLLAACIAPFVLAYIIIRGYALSWRTGEVTMIVGMVAFALIILDGIILGRPGGNKKNAVDISIEYGYLVGLLGAFLMAYGGFRRQSEDVKPQPPGV
jgi:hypothetical protein